MTTEPQNLKLDQIRLDGGTQPRVTISEKIVAEYADHYGSGVDLPPVTVFLRARRDGELADIRFGRRSLGTDFRSLRAAMRDFTAGESGSSGTAAVKLDCDYHLKYEYLIEALTAVSGYLDKGQVVTLAKRIDLTPPRRPG